MQQATELSRHLRDVFTGGNWTAVNFRDTLADVTAAEAVAKLADHNTIADLTFHVGYYLRGLTDVLRGGELAIRDKFSFRTPPVTTPAGWAGLRDGLLTDAETFAALVEELPEKTIAGPFVEEKYGSWQRNLIGLIEHCHYHLGQIVILKKLLRAA